MKKTIYPLFAFFWCLTIKAQSPKLSAGTLKEFAIQYYNCAKYIHSGCDYLSFQAGNNIGYSVADINMAIESIGKDIKFYNSLFKQFAIYYKHDKETLTLNFIGFNMKAKSAKELAEYIVAKFPVEHDSKTQKAEEKKEYVIIEKEARFVGGDFAFRKYLENSLSYPDSAAKYGYGGKVVVSFMIDKDGSVKDAFIVEGNEIGYGLPEEALRIVNSMPKWIPAESKEGKVRAYRRIPIVFETPEIKESKDSVNINNIQVNDNSGSDVIFFTGTKKFCDEDNSWYYGVTIYGSKIVLKCFPGMQNIYYKNKTKATEIIYGTIMNGKIITKDASEYLTNRFKFENDVLYEVNNEDGWNEYRECK